MNVPAQISLSNSQVYDRFSFLEIFFSHVRLPSNQNILPGIQTLVHRRDDRGDGVFVAEAFLLTRCHGSGAPPSSSCQLLLGYLGADFVSGFVHWFGDTWEP